MPRTPHTDAELYAFVQEIRSNKASADQRPAPPTKLEDWEGRVRRQNDVWSLVYGEEWKPVRAHALERLLEWHQLKETLRLLKKEAGRETMSLADIKFYALLPSATGTAWLELPRTFDLRFPEGWFATEVLPRIERKQERMLWRLTWEGTQGPKPSAHAGGDGRPDSTQKPTLRNLWGPKLSTEEVNKAKERAPLDKDGLLLCWGALTHMGCQNASCGRSHNDLQGKFEALDPCVQMQLLRRGGLRRMKPETKESAAEKIKLLRAGVIKDRVAKIDRKSGQGDSGEQAETRAGGDKAVQFSEVPEEFRAVDYTAAEAEIQEAIKGPDDAWLRRPPTALGCVEEAAGSSAPQEACDMVAKAQALAEGPVLGALKEASDDLFAWAATRVALAPHATLEEILGDMAIPTASARWRRRPTASLRRSGEAGRARAVVSTSRTSCGSPGCQAELWPRLRVPLGLCGTTGRRYACLRNWPGCCSSPRKVWRSASVSPRPLRRGSCGGRSLGDRARPKWRRRRWKFELNRQGRHWRHSPSWERPPTRLPPSRPRSASTRMTRFARTTTRTSAHSPSFRCRTWRIASSS